MMRRARNVPPLVILMLLMVMMILTSQKDVYEIMFEADRVPAGSTMVFRIEEGDRFVEEAGTWRAIDDERYQRAVYVSCPFCAGMPAPDGRKGQFEVALLGNSATALRDIVFDRCAARQQCRPLRVQIMADGQAVMSEGTTK